MFIKVRYRCTETKPDGVSIIELQGVVQNTTIGMCPGSAYALRDALSAALEDYENDIKNAAERGN
jgi:hypothetical protein